ncbi:hypothetical protein VQL36_04890 [Chengkuizengella sp. SCS-71B]|uniref:hypothetical protein n=1 Tax=Chengkuizengella sp. SCS-71B TaxID=3115290 RepID=UPI0032C2372F
MLVFYERETAERGKVGVIHHQPHLLPASKRAEGIEVESIPEPIKEQGKRGVLYVNPLTSELWYEYVDVPLTTDEELENLKETVDMILLDSLAGGV